MMGRKELVGEGRNVGGEEIVGEVGEDSCETALVMGRMAEDCDCDCHCSVSSRHETIEPGGPYCDFWIVPVAHRYRPIRLSEATS